MSHSIGFEAALEGNYQSILQRRIALKCESDSPAYDQSWRVVIVEQETETSWFGRPAANPNCPTLEWPKFAWRQVPFPYAEVRS